MAQVLPLPAKVLVSPYSAIGDTISCDAPYSAIGFSPCYACLWIAIGHFQGKKWRCSSDSLRYHMKHSATGVLLHLCRDRGGYFGRVAKTKVAISLVFDAFCDLVAFAS